MSEQDTPRPRRRMARNVDFAATPSPSPAPAPAVKTPSKLDRIEALLLADGGASIAELMTATGWQQHSVRGAMAGALRKRGLAISSDKTDDGVRRYHAVRA